MKDMGCFVAFQRQVSRLILSKGANPAVQYDHDEKTALMQAAQKSYNCLSVLLKYADDDLFDIKKWNALFHAADSAQLSCFKLLATKKSLLAKDKSGKYALEVALSTSLIMPNNKTQFIKEVLIAIDIYDDEIKEMLYEVGKKTNNGQILSYIEEHELNENLNFQPKKTNNIL